MYHIIIQELFKKWFRQSRKEVKRRESKRNHQTAFDIKMV